jgi:Mn-dependent DtxR family transcriptional regulator
MPSDAARELRAGIQTDTGRCENKPGTLAEMIGNTRSRISFLMNRLREMGLIDYNGGMHVRNSLVCVVLLD